VAVNAAVVAAAGTVTDAGTVNKVLLLERAATAPPAGAAPLNVTVQFAVAELDRLAGRQAREVGTIGAAEAPPPVTVLPVAEIVSPLPEAEDAVTLPIPIAVLVTPEAIVRFRTASGPFNMILPFMP
jgi:hypothetical protein